MTAYRKPIVLENGQLEQVQAGDGLDAGAFQVPASLGAPNQVLAVPASGTLLQWVDPEVSDIPLVNDNAGPIVIGAPVYVKADGNVDLAKADAQATADVLGLVKDISIATTVAGNVLLDGVLTATTAQWDAVAGTTGGLVPGTVYFLSAATAGQLTATPPSTAGQFVVRVGKALSATQLNLVLAAPIKL
jgi:hypothetical protein